MTLAFASMPGAKGLTMALVVDKKTFEVLSARVGVPGGALEDVKIMKGTVFQKPDGVAPAGAQEEFKLPSGKKVMAEVVSTKVGARTYTSWIGAEGSDLEGVLLKTSGVGVNKELSEDPVEIDHALRDKGLGGKARTVVGIKLSYSDKSEMVLTKDPISKCLAYGMLLTKGKGFTMTVVSLRTDAKPTLTWK
ncbi:MAG: hypothetical protein JKY65_04960 [Planctomycetes bacterium]|nr:hypothetical protein [Planctomycetota bacterium]